jgi:dUTP pyrophosphatase
MPEHAHISVKILRAKPHAELPSYSTPESAGADICACLDEPMVVPPSCRVLVPTGLRMEIPPGFEGQVRSRSGLAIRNGIIVLNSPGTIDSDYRGELMVELYNTGTEAYTISSGDRIAQLVIAPVMKAGFILSDAISGSERGTGGFGSTGI